MLKLMTSTGVAKLKADARKRGYMAAEKKARYGDFKASRGSANYELRQALSVLRAKSRFLERNSSSIRRYLKLLKINVIGESGIIFQCRVRKLDGELDATLNKRVQDEYKDWCESCTVDGQSMVDLQSQAVQTLARDGEVFWEIVFNHAYRDGFAINPIESDYIDETLNTKNESNGNTIKMGIEINKRGTPVAYHLHTQHPGDTTWFSYDMKKRYRRVTADRIIHCFEADRPGQVRGEPWTVTMINSVKMLDGYREAETTGRRIRSAIMGFFKRMMPTTQGIGDLADTVDEPENMLEMSMEPGILKELPAGLEFDKFDPGGSQTDYAAFESQVKMDISMGGGISVFSHGMETKGVSYSTGRSVLTEDRDFYKTVQGIVVRKLLKPLFPIWLGRRVVQEDSMIPPTRLKAIRKGCRYRARGWDWVDPSKEVTANKDALATKQTSLTRVAAARGIDVEDLFDEIVAEQESAEKRGLTLDYNTNSASANQPDGDDNDDTDGSSTNTDKD